MANGINELSALTSLLQIREPPGLSEITPKPVRRAYGQEIENFLLPLLRKDYQSSVNELEKIWEYAFKENSDYLTKGKKAYTMMAEPHRPLVPAKKVEVQMPSLTEIYQKREKTHGETTSKAKISAIIELLERGDKPTVRWADKKHPIYGAGAASYLPKSNTILLRKPKPTADSTFRASDTIENILAELAHSVQAKAGERFWTHNKPLEAVMMGLGQLLVEPSRRHSRKQESRDPWQKQSFLEQLVFGPLREKFGEAGSYLAGYTRPGAYEHGAHKEIEPRLHEDYSKIIARILGQ